jgi:hypothetical protein
MIFGATDFRHAAGYEWFARGVAWLYQSYVFVGILRPQRRKKAQGSDAPVLNLLSDRHFAWLPIPRDDSIRFRGILRCGLEQRILWWMTNSPADIKPQGLTAATLPSTRGICAQSR